MGKPGIRVTITDPKKTLASMLAAEKRKINDGITEWIVQIGNILISNTPVSTGQFMSNWSFYVGSPGRGFMPAGDYNALRRSVYHKWGPTPEVVRDMHARRLAEDVRSANLDFLSEGSTVVGFSNPSPYGVWLEKGHSKQASGGIVATTIRQVEKELDLVQMIEGRL